VALNCALLRDTLIESELFGHARGAFTGALAAKSGLVEAADGGTLLLDEVADMPLAVQGALLRFLELGEFRRLGETQLRHAEVRAIAATHRDLEVAVRSGAFRRDLLYRLDVIRIEIPALRERPDDLPALIAHVTRRVSARQGVPAIELDEKALAALCGYEFPGNVRELENEIERASALRTTPGPIPLDALSPRIALRAQAVSAESYADVVRSFKASLVERALAEAGGNRTRAAERLGVHRSNLVRMIRELGLETGSA
jgi:DNA-binding NtrC family response regulator